MCKSHVCVCVCVCVCLCACARERVSTHSLSSELMPGLLDLCEPTRSDRLGAVHVCNHGSRVSVGECACEGEEDVCHKLRTGPQWAKEWWEEAYAHPYPPFAGHSAGKYVKKRQCSGHTNERRVARAVLR
jgi:hypothetical protein